MRKYIPKLIPVFLLIILLITACNQVGPENPKPEEDQSQVEEGDPEKEVGLKPEDYFPLTQGSTWRYLGEGNEYATFTREVGIKVFGHVTAIGKIKVKESFPETEYEHLISQVEKSPVRCWDEKISHQMMLGIDEAKAAGDSLGGIFEIIITGVPVGLGSHVHWDRKLDGRLAFALMSIQGIKGVEIGIGFLASSLPGSKVHDEITYVAGEGLKHLSNRGGGIEGGMSNGEPIVLRAAMKPIPTLMKPLSTVDIIDKKPVLAQVERSDVCAVPAACIVGEAVVAWETALALLEKFGGDTLEELVERVEVYREKVKRV